jgi:alcohol dehydrogenase class IV
VLWGGFLETLPGGVVADSGMDALSHGIEAYVSSGATPFSDALAKEAVVQIWHRLPLAMEPGTNHARSELLTASCMAGAAFQNGGLGICHGLSHAIGGRFHLPHGKVNSILLPAVIAWNGAGEAAERYGVLARSCGLTSATGKPALWSLLRGIRHLRGRLHLPETMTQAGVPRGEYLSAIPQLAQAALEDICTRTNPRPADQGALEQLLREVV